jgi:hypothetical protein
VHAVTAQPGALEVRGCAQRAEHAQPCALRRRRAHERQLELDGFVRRRTGPAHNHGADADVVAAAPRRLLQIDERGAGSSDPRRERAAIERVQPLAAPPPAGEREQNREAKARPQNREHRADERRLERKAERHGHSETTGERAREQVRAPDHGSTSPLSASSRPWPMPGTASSSDTEWNDPCAWR